MAKIKDIITKYNLTGYCEIDFDTFFKSGKNWKK